MPSFKLAFDGQVNEGGMVSVTTTSNDGHESLFPALSVASQTIEVVPRLKVLPEGLEQENTWIPELSTAENDQAATAEAELPLDGEMISGEAEL